MALGRSMLTVGGFTGISRILGFVRDILIAAVIGAGPVADAFFVAFKLPNLFRRIFAEGAFNAAFVPIFSRKLEQDGEDEAQTFARQVFATLAVVLVVLSILAMAFMPWVTLVLAPGFLLEEGASASYAELGDLIVRHLSDPTGVSEKFDLAVSLGVITFPYLFFMSLVALLSGVLNALRRFAAAAAAPVVLNLCFIVALAGVMPFFEDKGLVMSWTVVVAGVAQLALLVVACHRAKFLVLPSRPSFSKDMRTLLKRMGPGVLSAGAMQINVQIGTLIASLQASAVSYLYYADRVYQLPLGLIGVAFGIVLLPELSRRLAASDETGANTTLNRGIEMAMALTLPATAALIAMPWAIVVVLFEHGQFSREASDATAAALMAYSAGLPAFVLMKLLQPAFFARHDTVTPFRMALLSIVLNIVLSFILFQKLGHIGIALATTVSSWVNVLALYIVLRNRGHYRVDARLIWRLPKIIAASLVMASALWAGKRWLLPFLNGPLLEKALALAVLVAGGLVIYGLLATLIGAVQLRDLKGLLRRS
ncbi:murein biosynthesis integral membrane protein MurJ [Kiloniella sp. b19]|uniref:murein biosynthesis integral membrane protein MurJ n=1 Tax=Kiloniella sp. GXU_MW_B19 TaxID=3141326 RepID=UPI0031E07631